MSNLNPQNSLSNSLSSSLPSILNTLEAELRHLDAQRLQVSLALEALRKPIQTAQVSQARPTLQETIQNFLSQDPASVSQISKALQAQGLLGEVKDPYQAVYNVLYKGKGKTFDRKGSLWTLRASSPKVEAA